MGAGAYDDDVPQVSSAPAQRSKNEAQRSTRDEMSDEAPQYPRQRPAARKFDSGLGEEQKSATDHADQEPGQDERAEFVEETDAALRVIEREGRKDREREQSDTEYRCEIAVRRVPLPQIAAIGDESGGDDEKRIENAQPDVEQRRVFLKQAALRRHLDCLWFELGQRRGDACGECRTKVLGREAGGVRAARARVDVRAVTLEPQDRIDDRVGCLAIV